MKKFFVIIAMLMLVFPALHAQNIDYLQKAREFLANGDCERAEYAYQDYKSEHPKGNAEMEAAIKKCKDKPLQLTITKKTDCKCHGDKNGSIEVKASGGKPFDGGRYKFSFSGQQWTEYQSTHTYSNLAQGNYTISVMDANGNKSSKSVSVIEPSAINVNTTVKDDKIIVKASGGKPFGENEYKFSINGGKEYQRRKECWFTDLRNGSYNIKVNDASSCVSTAKAEVKQAGNNSTAPPSQQGNNKSQTQSTDSAGKYVSIIIERSGCCFCGPSAKAKVVNHNDCIGCSDGQIQVTVDNSYAGIKYKFSCDGGENWIESTSPYIFRNLKTGLYHIKVKDNSGVTNCGIMRVTEPGITSGSLHGHEWVDLGLPSCTCWATCNVGASSPSEYGGYFAWGETKPKSSYTKDNYMYFSDPKVLPESADAATVNWGKGWRMPTEEEFKELEDMCTWTWMSNGFKVIGPNGNSIFLPAAGGRPDSKSNDAGYWTSIHSHSYYTDCAYFLFFSSNYYSTNINQRYYGLSVRPVCASKN